MDEILDFGPVEDQMQNIIKVIGVGGGGCNAVSRMYDEGIQGVSFAVLNTDSASLAHSPVPVKLQLGSGLSRRQAGDWQSRGGEQHRQH